MNTTKFAITKEGRVYRLREHDRPLLLGHISCLVREETPLGREVRAWWQARLASDEPTENIERTDDGEFCFVPCPETVAAISQPEPDRELARGTLLPIKGAACPVPRRQYEQYERKET
jgi:hypothetical protein